MSISNLEFKILQWILDGEDTEQKLLSVSWEDSIDPLELSEALDALKASETIDQFSDGQIMLTCDGMDQFLQLKQRQQLVANAKPHGVRLLKNGIAMTFSGSEVQEVRYLNSGATVIVAGGEA